VTRVGGLLPSRLDEAPDVDDRQAQHQRARRREDPKAVGERGRVRSRALLSLAALALALCLERAGYYGLRSVLMLHLRDSGMEIASIGALLGLSMWVYHGSAVIGGALALAAGPRWTALVGTVLAAVGAALLGADGPASLAMMLVSAGAGIFRPCMWAAAAETVFAEDDARAVAGVGRMASSVRFATVAACATLFYACANVAALVAAPVAARLFGTVGFGAVAWTAAGLDVLAGGCAAVAAVIGSGAPIQPGAAPGQGAYRDPAVRVDVVVPAKDAPRAIGGLAILGGVTAMYVLAMTASYAPRPRGSVTLAYSINPIVVLVVAAICFFAWLAFAQSKSAPAPLLAWGAGLAVFAVGVLVTGAALDGEGGASTVPYLGGVVLMAAGEAASGPIGLAYASTATRTRASTLVVGAFGLTSAVGGFGTIVMGSRGVLLVLGVLLLAAGVIAAARAKSLHERFFA
jgi:dipeptide/tripeptide permease